MALAPADDGFHPFGPDRFWQESWYFDWSSDDGSLAGFARQGFYPNLGEAWLWIYLFVNGRVVAVRDHDVVLGNRWGRTEHRTNALWWDFRPQERLTAWSLQAEAVGIEVGSPRELIEAEVGVPVPVGLDLSFEAIAPPYQWVLPAGTPHDDDGTPTSRFEQFGAWSGEILLGHRTYSLVARGERDHSWGRRDWWSAPWVYTAWNTGADFAVHAAGTTIPGIDVCDGFVWRDGSLHRVIRFSRDTTFDDNHMPVRATYEYEDDGGGSITVAVTPEFVVPVPIETREGSTGPTRFRRGAARFDVVDGGTGRGDIEYNSPLAGPFASDG